MQNHILRLGRFDGGPLVIGENNEFLRQFPELLQPPGFVPPGGAVKEQAGRTDVEVLFSGPGQVATDQHGTGRETDEHGESTGGGACGVDQQDAAIAKQVAVSPKSAEWSGSGEVDEAPVANIVVLTGEIEGVSFSLDGGIVFSRGYDGLSRGKAFEFTGVVEAQVGQDEVLDSAFGKLSAFELSENILFLRHRQGAQRGRERAQILLRAIREAVVKPRADEDQPAPRMFDDKDYNIERLRAQRTTVTIDELSR